MCELNSSKSRRKAVKESTEDSDGHCALAWADGQRGQNWSSTGSGSAAQYPLSSWTQVLTCLSAAVSQVHQSLVLDWIALPFSQTA